MGKTIGIAIEDMKDMSASDQNAVIGRVHRHEDCDRCNWRVKWVSALKFVTTDTDLKQYNHSTVRKVVRLSPKMFEIEVSVWRRGPEDAERVILNAEPHEIVVDPHGGSWVHSSPLHPDNDETRDKKLCGWPTPAPRCPKCNSRKITTTQEAYGDSTDCPECSYHSFRSIGD